MTVFQLIVAMDQHRGIGKNNQLMWHLPADLRHFKYYTQGKPVIMGRKTYESIGHPLPGRENIILTRSTDFVCQQCFVFTTPEAILVHLKDKKEAVVIGGAEIFELFMPYVNELVITEVCASFDADVFFPKIDWSLWTLEKESCYQKDEKNVFNFKIKMWKRKNPKKVEKRD